MKWSSLNAQEKLKTLNQNSREMKGQAENVIEFLTKLLSSSGTILGFIRSQTPTAIQIEKVRGYASCEMDECNIIQC